MQFFINGNKVAEAYAFDRFQRYQLSQGVDPASIRDMWDECLEEESSRDAYLPDNLEIIA